MKKPKISVIIPVFNAEQFLRQCLDSVLRQPMKALEIICVNDGSTDASLQILEEYAKKDSRIHVISQNNQHAGIARNNGLENANGEYIHFLDADDKLTDNAYKKAYEIAHKFKLDWIKVKAYGIHAFTEDIICEFAPNMMTIDSYKRPFSFLESARELTSVQFCAIWCGLYRRAYLIENNIRFSSLYCYNDMPFYFLAAAHAKRVMVADIYLLYYRRYNPESLAGSNLRRFDCLMEAFNILYQECRFLPSTPYALILSSVIDTMFRLYHNARETKIYFEHVEKLICDFVTKFDLSILSVVYDNSQWYLDYLILKWEINWRNALFSTPEKEYLLKEIKDKCGKIIPMPKPLEILQPESTIILYGAGKYGKLAHKILHLLNCCKIVNWVDRNWLSLREDNLPVSNPETIPETKFDYVLIAVENQNTCSYIEIELMRKGIPRKKIFSFAPNTLLYPQIFS